MRERPQRMGYGTVNRHHTPAPAHCERRQPESVVAGEPLIRQCHGDICSSRERQIQRPEPPATSCAVEHQSGHRQCSQWYEVEGGAGNRAPAIAAACFSFRGLPLPGIATQTTVSNAGPATLACSYKLLSAIRTSIQTARPICRLRSQGRRNDANDHARHAFMNTSVSG